MNAEFEDLREYVEHDNNNKNTKLLAGLLIGLGVGVLAGLLLAPRSGKDTLKRVAHSSDDLRNQLTDLINKASKVAADYTEKGKDLASKVVKRG
jgi:gas vesicle protein